MSKANKEPIDYSQYETEDCTPTWESIMNLYISSIAEKGMDAKAAITEIYRLAKAYDNVVAERNKREKEGKSLIEFSKEEWEVIKYLVLSQSSGKAPKIPAHFDKTLCSMIGELKKS